ncbi:MAG: glucose-6-phosphate 1-epimerase [Gammaproteobacteria bacterium]|jgi:glucose-6-phosphate 1-epimerase
MLKMSQTDAALIDNVSAPTIELHHGSGASATIHLNGAHVTSWQMPGGQEQLFTSTASAFGLGYAIRGGVPIIFPQFSDYGPIKRHGFARNLPWSLIEHEGARAVLALIHNEETVKLWPHQFRCDFEVRLNADTLTLRLTVHNHDTSGFEFSAALHTYLRVEDIATTEVHGLFGLHYTDNNDRCELHTDHALQVEFPGEIDRVYFGVPPSMQITDGTRSLRVSAHGFTDAVVWNPGAEKSSALADMESNGYCHFVCVEAAVIEQPIHLDPGESWSGTQTLSR